MKYSREGLATGYKKKSNDARDKSRNRTATTTEGGESKSKPKWANRKERQEVQTKDKLTRLKVQKTEVEQKLAVAQSATASMGKFDRKAHKDERKLRVKRRKQYRNFGNVEEQVERNKEILALVMKSQGAKKLDHSL